ncbi:MAG: hypothetical protein OIN88_13755, partial [Candidatus Methanoperedens sp.]|nr:hypothetical protein [Candidatus Methanoperedens sp.]
LPAAAFTELQRRMKDSQSCLWISPALISPSEMVCAHHIHWNFAGEPLLLKIILHMIEANPCSLLRGKPFYNYTLIPFNCYAFNQLIVF